MSKMTKDALIQFKVSELEKIYLQKKAEKEGVTLTDYIMRRVLPEKDDILKKFEKRFEQKKKETLTKFEEEIIQEFEQELTQKLSA